MAIELPSPPKIGMVSLGCPKNLVDSERILTKLRSDGYGLSPDYAGADVVLVNTCGFLDSAKEESLEAIGEAIAENGRVIVTGCMGDEAEAIRARFPKVLAITGAHQYEAVVGAVHEAAPVPPSPYIDLVPEAGLKLTPRHYSYLKISEGCNHRCSFCIIPSIRGDLVSRRPDAILREAEKLVAAGTRELLVISQDTSAYGLDLRHKSFPLKGGGEVRAHMTDLARELGKLGAWVRLHYVYPYPHVDHVIPLMAEGVITPYLDIPFQHASPSVLKAMKRPANEARVLERIAGWRAICPDIAIRSTFVVGFPGETEEDFRYLLDWLDEAQLDRVGAFRFEPVAGAPANDLPGAVPKEVKEERYARIMDKCAAISAAKLQAKVGRTLDVIVDAVDLEEGGATGRSKADAPEIDGEVQLRDAGHLSPGDIVAVEIEDADEHDLFGVPVGASR
ncbi:MULTISPECIES: 30S ribosomal protein S12 methylthiotransferase RimO [unclassified Sphingomonas]|uniref:30S ribosomal protein S12 methylthiotransferase RimO n=1 Tax=unclassified Sphingomonas TaxID=196159 RepID=UPI0007019839|nr:MULTISPECIES: 30S ribosomal protein S12 methylthiotransferase RimO [unclassified Sphingomonas]KQX18525.1 ribosomal protein S12 methylthiotransferase RimO [Sphingomonas sp. Root1294]KQY72151.1 ribosomal protein S12 methylthiotransferase RimO [Sphingomonas sp. Root50]KRB94577.1 ribosomal protein S12 methylthiotransferase RimO [Sphingomonas sp. Root720]